MRNDKSIGLVMVLVLILPLPAAAETVFTFQGRLGSAGAPAEGAHDFVFRLFHDSSSGAQIGSDLARPGVDVIEGVFTAQLDFGDGPFEGSPRWLEIDVRETGGGAYTTLETRFRVGSAPFAIEALAIAPGAVDTAAIQNNAVTRSKLANNSVGSAQIEAGAVTSSDILDGTIVAADLANQSVSRSRIKFDAVGADQVEDNSIGSDDIQNGSIQSIDIASSAIGSAQIASNAVTSLEIENGTLLSEDVAADHILATKSRVYVSLGTIANLPGQSNAVSTASCADANDIPLTYFCTVLTTLNNVILRGSSQLFWSSTTEFASVTCSYRNEATSLGADVRAEIACMAVD